MIFVGRDHRCCITMTCLWLISSANVLIFWTRSISQLMHSNNLDVGKENDDAVHEAMLIDMLTFKSPPQLNRFQKQLE
jgi:hypothetical protein